MGKSSSSEEVEAGEDRKEDETGSYWFNRSKRLNAVVVCDTSATIVLFDNIYEI